MMRGTYTKKRAWSSMKSTRCMVKPNITGYLDLVLASSCCILDCGHPAWHLWTLHSNDGTASPTADCPTPSALLWSVYARPSWQNSRRRRTSRSMSQQSNGWRSRTSPRLNQAAPQLWNWGLVCSSMHVCRCKFVLLSPLRTPARSPTKACIYAVQATRCPQAL